MPDHIALPTHYLIFGSRLPQPHPRRTKITTCNQTKTHALYACPSFSTVFGYLSMMYMFILGKSLLLLGMVKSEENAQLESTNHKKTSFRGFICKCNELNAVSKVVQEWRIHQKWPYTLPEPNIAPARRPSLKGCYIFQPQ